MNETKQNGGEKKGGLPGESKLRQDYQELFLCGIISSPNYLIPVRKKDYSPPRREIKLIITLSSLLFSSVLPSLTLGARPAEANQKWDKGTHTEDRRELPNKA
jgi:hypothetical protein